MMEHWAGAEIDFFSRGHKKNSGNVVSDLATFPKI